MKKNKKPASVSTLLGADTFRRAMDLYFERFDGQAVTTDDFVDCMEEASGRDLAQFRRWYSQAGTPELRVAGRYDQVAHRFELTIDQSCPPSPGQPEKAPYHIPFAFALLDRHGVEMPLRLEGTPGVADRTRVLELREPREVFRFEGVASQPVPSLLRGFSAPVKVSYDYSDDELIFLMARETDGFNRWDAAQTLSQRLLMRMVAEPGLHPPGDYLEAFRATLENRDADTALSAEILTLPSEVYLGEQMEQVDVEGIHRARERLKEVIASSLRGELLHRYLREEGAGDYRLTPEAVGRRRLRNLCLDYLMQLDDPDARALCEAQCSLGDNMTDVISALGLLVSSGSARREALLEAFLARWRHDALVVDKWFMVQALSKRPDTLARVEELARHPAFSLRNPNNVRSLVGSFCAGNPVRFHAPDGDGYRFLSAQVRRLDGLNPQVAAHMMRSMAGWRRYDASRQRLMRREIESILSLPDISRDLFEVASRILGNPG